MKDVRFHFREIVFHGPKVNGDYQLICHGKLVGEGMVKILSFFHFHHALQSSSSSLQQASVIPITPLQEWTSINIRVYDDKEEIYWDLELVVDLNIHRILIETKQKLSPPMVSRILSCIGIKNGKEILYLTSNIHIPRRKKLKNRHNS
ncbi:hypothetical protein J6TS2_15060 [Heyndrickxia sporothermodurans]|nr:hypothetical protein J6TS2_15060 [Heyndrickxia sporothermodurans]